MLIFCVYRPAAIKRHQHSVNLYYAALTSSVTQRWTHLCENSRVRWMLSLSINRTTMGFQCGAPAANQNARHPAKARYQGYLCKCDLAGYEMEMLPGAQDGQNLISWRWSLPSPIDPVWWRSMHAISSYGGNRPTHKQTHRQDRLQYTAPLKPSAEVQ